MAPHMAMTTKLTTGLNRTPYERSGSARWMRGELALMRPLPSVFKLCALARQHPLIANHQTFTAFFGQRLEAAPRVLPPEANEAAEVAGCSLGVAEA